MKKVLFFVVAAVFIASTVSADINPDVGVIITDVGVNCGSSQSSVGTQKYEKQRRFSYGCSFEGGCIEKSEDCYCMGGNCVCKKTVDENRWNTVEENCIHDVCNNNTIYNNNDVYNNNDAR